MSCPFPWSLSTLACSGWFWIASVYVPLPESWGIHTPMPSRLSQKWTVLTHKQPSSLAPWAEEFCSVLYLFPITAVKKKKKTTTQRRKATQIYSLIVLVVRAPKWVLDQNGLKIKVSIELGYFRRLQGRIYFLAFQLLDAAHILWLLDPSSIFKANSLAPSNLFLTLDPAASLL